MAAERGRERPHIFDREKRAQIADLVQRLGARGAVDAFEKPVSLNTVLAIAREFGITLKKGRQPAKAGRYTFRHTLPVKIGLEEVMAWKEIAKFASGAEVAHGLFHLGLYWSETSMTILGITATPGWNIAAGVIHLIIGLGLGVYAWGGFANPDSIDVVNQERRHTRENVER